MVGGIGRFFPWCVRDVAKAICAAAGAAALWPTVDPQARAIVGPQAKVPDRWLAQGSLGGVTALAYARAPRTRKVVESRGATSVPKWCRSGAIPVPPAELDGGTTAGVPRCADVVAIGWPREPRPVSIDSALGFRRFRAG